MAAELGLGETHDPTRDLLHDISGLKEQKSYLSSVMTELLEGEFKDKSGHVPCHMEKNLPLFRKDEVNMLEKLSRDRGILTASQATDLVVLRADATFSVMCPMSNK